MEEQKETMTEEQEKRLRSLFRQLEWVLYAGDGETTMASLSMFRPIAKELVEFPSLQGEEPMFDAKKAAELHPSVLPLTWPDRNLARRIYAQCHLNRALYGPPKEVVYA